MTAAPTAAADLLGAAMVDFEAGRPVPLWLRVAPGRRLAHELAAYFAPVPAQERALLDLVDGPVLDVGFGPARHARLLQAHGLTAIGLDRSLLALGVARALGLRHWLHADALAGLLPACAPPCSLTATSAWPGTRPAPCASFTAWPPRTATAPGRARRIPGPGRALGAVAAGQPPGRRRPGRPGRLVPPARRRGGRALLGRLLPRPTPGRSRVPVGTQLGGDGPQVPGDRSGGVLVEVIAEAVDGHEQRPARPDIGSGLVGRLDVQDLSDRSQVVFDDESLMVGVDVIRL